MANNNDKKVLNVPALRFPEFTEEWKEERLSKIAELSKGVGISKEQLSEDGEPCILYGELYTKYKSEIIHKVISKTNIESSNLKRSKRNDVIIPCSGETAIDIAVARCVPFDNILLGGDLNIIRLHKDDGAFMAYQLNGKRKIDIAKLAQGVSVVHLYGENIKAIKTYNPCLQEQQKIVKLLSMLDERIEVQNKIIEKLETLIKGIVDSIFTANKFPKVPFKEIYVRAGEGGTPATSNPEYYDNGTIPFIKIDDLQNKYIKTNKDCITELGLQKSSAWIVPANSIIYSNGATIGAISINLFPVCTKQGILGVVPKADINVEFLYYFMTSTAFTKAVERIVTEGTMRTAYLKDINHIPCPVPYPVKQDEIAKMLSTLSEKLENEVIFQMKLQKQKEFLLSQMFI
ncbi:restriction endonuclease subunit S [Odoribacter splanchnicus]|uniref:restriction endonuclease subunit S n=1 Tax=Odoribacter splanchnicus TaxID=28118 RepID=UPI00189BD248|nr:restriction endonuclease subunit S [Odoribacter splanchnicus]